MTSQTGKRTVTAHISNISRSNSILVSQYIIKNIFLKNHAQNAGEKILPEPFLKKQN